MLTSEISILFHCTEIIFISFSLKSNQEGISSNFINDGQKKRLVSH
jgi:hypothetical protein